MGRAGIGYRFGKESRRTEIDLTASLSTAAKGDLRGFATNYSEALLGLSQRVIPSLTLYAAGGIGISNGFGTPDWRAVAGLRFHQGGNQSDDPDGDGVRGAADKCPTEAEDRDGFEDSDGCPDLDNDKDGILDVNDGAPNEPEDMDGFEDTDGVPDPDNDADGVLDGEDNCPLQAGAVANLGCPSVDTDGDGIMDNVDQCPDAAEDLDGFGDADGCPDPDNDSDGVFDGADRCPLEAGPAENAGCPDPDTDGDGVVDRMDNCPAEPGEAKYNGCKSKQLVSITDGSLVIIESVYFKTNKAVIEKSSFKLLDNVAAVIVSHSGMRVQVEGHTDSQGNDASNKDLSQRRAEAVVTYLAKKGVEASRLVAKGFGEESPIASNDTKAGRQQNRRVVFTILKGGEGVSTTVQGADGSTIEP